MNVYTYIRFSAFLPIYHYFIILGITLPVGLIFVFQSEYYKKQLRKKYTKEFEELEKYSEELD